MTPQRSGRSHCNSEPASKTACGLTPRPPSPSQTPPQVDEHFFAPVHKRPHVNTRKKKPTLASSPALKNQGWLLVSARNVAGKRTPKADVRRSHPAEWRPGSARSDRRSSSRTGRKSRPAHEFTNRPQKPRWRSRITLAWFPSALGRGEPRPVHSLAWTGDPRSRPGRLAARLGRSCPPHAHRRSSAHPPRPLVARAVDRARPRFSTRGGRTQRRSHLTRGNALTRQPKWGKRGWRELSGDPAYDYLRHRWRLSRLQGAEEEGLRAQVLGASRRRAASWQGPERAMCTENATAQ